jgi:hypothetical protein
VPDLHGWITQQIDATAARADRWHDIECDAHTTTLIDAAVIQGATLCDCGGPASVLRRCAVDRRLLTDLLAEKHTVCDDSWYHCVAADGTGDRDCTQPCDCGRDERVERRMRLLAEAYGYDEEPITDQST